MKRIPRLALGGFAALLLAGCTPPPAPPAAQAEARPPSATRRILEAQFAQPRPADAPGLNGDEAAVIYAHYLRGIGAAPRGGARDGRGEGAGQGAGYAPGPAR